MRAVASSLLSKLPTLYIRYTMTEDDGLTVAYKEGQARTTEFTLQQGGPGGRAKLGISVSGAYADRLGADFWCVPV